MQTAQKVAYTPKEAAQVLRIGVNRVYQLCHMDGFPCIMVGSRFIIPVDKLHEWVNTQAANKAVIS